MKSINRKIIVTFTIIFVLSTSALIIMNVIMAHREITNTLNSYLARAVEDARLMIRGESSFQEVRNRLLSMKIGENGYVFTMDKSGTFIIHPRNEGLDLSEAPYIQEMIKRKKGRITYNQSDKGPRQGQSQITYFTYDPDREWIIAATSYEKEFYSGVNTIILYSLILGLISLVLFILFGASISRRIVKPIKNTSDALYDIASGEGDLTTELLVMSDDEMGVMAENFNTFLGKLKSIINTLKSRIKEINNKNELIVKNSFETSSAVQDIASTVDTVAELSEQVLGNTKKTTEAVSKISLRMNDLESYARQQVTTLEQSSSSIDTMVISIDSVSETANRQTEEIRKLNEMTKKGRSDYESMIRQVSELSSSFEKVIKSTSVINKISARTTLLGMNAAIEAAHAGEAGLGFSVVAEEIRNLSESSAVQSAGISQTVTENVNLVSSLKKIVEQSSLFFCDIEKMIEKTSDSFSDITLQTTHISESAEIVETSIEELNTVAQEVKSAATDISEETSHIDSSSEMILSSSRALKESLADVNREIGDIKGSMMNMDTSLTQIADNMTGMQDEIMRFKTEDALAAEPLPEPE